MLIEQTLFGEKNKVNISIERCQAFEPEEGYYLGFSGGKDSCVSKAILIMAGVKFDAHYNLTTVDPPELVKFIKQVHPDVIIDKPKLSMWQLIEKKSMPPTRIVRYCCEALKEHGGKDRFCVTGVRWAESVRRKNSRGVAEVQHSNKAKRVMILDDNAESRRMIESCTIKGKRVLNPIIDWSDADVWEFIKQYNIPYCKLYDEGFKRLGCIACPMSGQAGMERDFARWPTYRKAYIKAFDRMIAKRIADGLKTEWKTGEEVMQWWVYGNEQKYGDIKELEQ